MTTPNARQLTKQERITDTMELEQERGITIKMQPLTIQYKGYTINIIDTPGHVDFSYEVSRSLKAVEGAILLVDVTKGVQAQTVENLLKALKYDLHIIPVLNKVDLASNELIEKRLREIESILGFKEDQILLTSGKTGHNVPQLLDRIIKEVPSPKALASSTGKYPVALVLDAKYDNYYGIVATVRVYNQPIKAGTDLWISNQKIEFTPTQVGIFTPTPTQTQQLEPGQIGYIVTNLKDSQKFYVGATITSRGNNFTIEGYQQPQPKLFSSFYPQEPTTYPQLREALHKLKLNDFSLRIEDETSPLLGKGFRIGFLGMLHLEITKERLKREFNVNTLTTYPLVPYKIVTKDEQTILLRSINQFPPQEKIKQIFEPYIHAEIYTPFEYFSDILDLIKKSRGLIKDQQTVENSSINTTYLTINALIPFSEIIENFFNKLKSVSHGYASLSYEKIEYLPSEAVKVTILILKQPYEALSFVTHPQKATYLARKILATLKKTIPRTVVPIPLQAAVGGKIIARETIPALRKNVTAKLYGGDVRRKLKLLRNQTKLKKYRAQFIKIKIPHDFLQKVLSQV